MDQKTEVNDSLPKKRKYSEIKNEASPKTKKLKSFSAKEFRTKLGSPDKLNALKEFLTALNETSGRDYMFDYLKNGGNVLELLQMLENDSTISPAIVFQLITELLLEINANYGQYYNSAYESCRYLINNYLPVLHKMLGLSSSKEERKICLKLLTAIAALSSSLAKDILLNVKFHSANIELLTKNTGEKNSSRDCFIHFLTALLIDSDVHALSILLEKSGLLTSIISGLQYDVADTVCVVVAAMKNHILENSIVMKTTKMHVFNTFVVRDIVNLYNWKGPEGLKALDKNNKTIFEVDKLAKSKVNECVHDFLLTLCTSHKHGVIFRDPLVGLGRKNQNGLMYTVLDSLDRPWEHSYASELVIKICRSCPDLTKNMWTILKPFLEPRLTEKWLKAMNFLRNLLKELEPQCLEYCKKDLSAQQLAHIIEILVSPAPILKVLLPENNVYENSEVKKHIFVIIFDMLERVNVFVQYLKNCTSMDNYKKIKQHLSTYIAKNYPVAQRLVDDWKSLYLDQNKTDDDDTKFDCLEVIVNIFTLYEILAPQLLFDLNFSSLDLKDFLIKLSSNVNKTESKRLATLQMRIINIFIDIDHSYFLPKNEIFSYALSFLIKLYYESKSREVQLVVYKLLKNTNIFEGSLYEINIWMNGIFNSNTVSDIFLDNFIDILAHTSKNILDYQQKLTQINIEESFSDSYENLIENILNASDDYNVNWKTKQNHFSPLILGFLRHLQDNPTKKMVKYTEFVLINLLHSQTILHKYFSVIEEYKTVIPSHIFNYIISWKQGCCEPLQKYKGSLNFFKYFGEIFLNGTIEESNFNEVFYPDYFVDILRAFTFYFSNLISFGAILPKHSKNWICYIEYLNKQSLLDDTCLELIFGNSINIKHFNIMQIGKDTSGGICTRAVFDVVKALKNASIAKYVEIYSCSIFNTIIKCFKKPKKAVFEQNIKEYLIVFPLSYSNSVKILDEMSEKLEILDVLGKPMFYDILTYSINSVSMLCEQNPDHNPLDKHIVLNITSYMVESIKANKDCSNLSQALKSYLEIFPHAISEVDHNLFTSILQINEYNKDNAELVVFLFERNFKLMCEIENNIEHIAEKKGIILPLIHIMVNFNTPENFLKIIYEHLENALLKALQKPQKVGQHFLKNYDIPFLIEKFMPVDKCKPFVEKIQKFEVVEVFHVRFLEACYKKVLKQNELNEKQLGNIILTFIHLQTTLLKRKTKCDDTSWKIDEVSKIFNQILEEIATTFSNNNYKGVSSNETFKTFCKFALKFGVSGEHSLLKTMCLLLKILSSSMEMEDVSLLLEMLLSHSEFLNVVLSEHTETKLEILSLYLIMCQNWGELMERSHVAVILSAYRGLITKCDRTILVLLSLFEKRAHQTQFYSFKPFLWGRAAATHYSVRTQIERSLMRQPKISDVLGILKEEIINHTITHFPINESLHQEGDVQVTDCRCYDLKFLLPLFSHLLAPEQQVKTYIFTRSGALSLTVLGLSSQDKEIRTAACHVLSRFHFHLEASQTGKDNLLWIRFVEVLCKGASLLPNFKINKFVSIFFARMALILTNPNHVMYTPLFFYLSAKQDLDLTTVPELYTLLYSTDVNFKDYRTFILEILRDGLRTEKDFLSFLKSMGYKLFSELFSSCLSDADTKLLILDILHSACKIPLGVKMLCENNSLLSHLCNLLLSVLSEKAFGSALISIVKIFLEIIKIKSDEYTNKFIFELLLDILKSELFLSIKQEGVRSFYEVLYRIFINCPGIIEQKGLFICSLLEKVDDKVSKRMQKYGCNYIREKSFDCEIEDKFYYLRLLIFKLLS